ncbi:MAG: alpha-1,2-fucosyltransferase [Lachnospiraceae bacterium]|nr:alpha-1,2-fucosyltransferase [Lachnospiraceae bacterium]
MKIQYLNGGLANQVFQYIFVRYAQLAHPENDDWVFDDSFFYVNAVHNGYELEKVFHLHPNLLSQNFDTDTWAQFIKNKQQGISIPQSFKDLGFNIEMISEFENYKSHNPFDGMIHRVPSNAYIPEITGLQGDFLYYHGYWLHPDWFRKYRAIFLEELALSPIPDGQNARYAEMIQSSRSVAVHIRRGDYVKLGWATDAACYLEKTKEILTLYPDAVFFIFSDDITWCRKNQEALGFLLPSKTIYVEGNEKGANHIDLHLMSLCKIMLLGKSAFGYLGMLLNKQLEKCIFLT